MAKLKVAVAGAALAAWVLAGCGMSAGKVAPGGAMPGGAMPDTGGGFNAQTSLMRLRPDLPGGKERRQSVLFSYIAMDDHLTRFAEQFLGAIHDSASDRVYDVAFADFQGPDNSYLFDFRANRAVAKSFLAPDLKEVTSNDPRILASTLNWAFSHYQGDFKALDLFAHGGGAIGFGTDEHQLKGGQKFIMSVAEVGDAIRSGLKGRRVDLINMLSCLMGNIEYAYELRDVGDVLIASQDSIFATKDTTVEFTAELNRQIAGQNPDARRIGRHLGAFADAKNPNSGYFTISAIDLQEMNGIARTVNALSHKLIDAMPRHATDILEAYDAVPHLQHADWLGFNRDLWTFCTKLQKVRNAGVRDSALEVKAALKKAILFTRDKEGAAANGLSIAMPDRKGEMAKIWDMPVFQTRLNCQFEKRTVWDKFLSEVRKAP
jgi:hypothetical protein